MLRVEVGEKSKGISAPVLLCTDLQLISLFSDLYFTLPSIISAPLQPFGVLMDRLDNTGPMVPA